MGTRAYSEAANMVKRRANMLQANYKLQVLFDGVTTTGSGQQPTLPGNELWWDGTSLFRIGLNIGPTFQNIGPCDCEVFGSLAPKEYAQLISEQASLITLMSGRWKSLGVIKTGEVVNTQTMVYTLFRFVFAAGTHGEVVAVTL